MACNLDNSRLITKKYIILYLLKIIPSRVSKIKEIAKLPLVKIELEK